MLKEIATAVSHFFSVTGLLRKHRLLHYYLYPLLLGIIFYFALIRFIIRFSGRLTELIFGPVLPEKLPEFEGFFSFLNALGSFSLHGAVSVLAGLVLFLLSSRFSKYIILILLSPVFSLLSERVDEIISGQTYPFSPVQFLKDIIRGTLIAIRNLFIELMLIAILSLAGLFAAPVAILVAPALWLAGAYFYGFSMLDYTCERRRMSIPDGIRFIRRRKFFALGNGMMYSVTDMIPVIGWIIAPVNAVAGATSGLLELEKKDALEGAQPY